MDYLIAVQAPAYPLGPGRFAIESAFAEHLKMMVRMLEGRFDRIVLLAPTLAPQVYEHSKSSLAELSAGDDRIVLEPLPEAEFSIGRFWWNIRPLWRRLRGIAKQAGIVHTGMSESAYRPYLALLNLAAWLESKPIVFFIDIDFRQLSRRYYKLGDWSYKSYLINRLFHDKVKRAQVGWAIRNCDLVLLKSVSMVAELGQGRDNVKFFLDAAHGDKDVISNAQLEQRIARLDDTARELQIVYFGRLVPYKGCDYIVEAVARARARGARIAMTFIGDGECLPQLKEQAHALGIAGSVTFLPSVRYGPELFDLVDRADLAIAAPRVEDTPRAALDAMARGLPIVAFDVDYNKTLSETSGAVAIASWPEPASLADQLLNLDKDRSRIVEMSRKAVAFARENSQDFWLQQRLRWTFEAFDRRSAVAEKCTNASAVH
jgi:glycosyltransferase involved in cell wall biosynthesis